MDNAEATLRIKVLLPYISFFHFYSNSEQTEEQTLTKNHG